tara:strand:+ start:287 stop:418 length:132 start_codon:yes stop_codon:yes gene_type:complete
MWELPLLAVAMVLKRGVNFLERSTNGSKGYERIDPRIPLDFRN